MSASTAVGFTVNNVDLRLAMVTKGTTSFTGLEMTVSNAALLGLDGLDLEIRNASVKLNKTTDVENRRIDWATALNETSDRLSRSSDVGDQEIHVLFSILY